MNYYLFLFFKEIRMKFSGINIKAEKNTLVEINSYCNYIIFRSKIFCNFCEIS